MRTRKGQEETAVIRVMRQRLKAVVIAGRLQPHPWARVSSCCEAPGVPFKLQPTMHEIQDVECTD